MPTISICPLHTHYLTFPLIAPSFGRYLLLYYHRTNYHNATIGPCCLLRTSNVVCHRDTRITCPARCRVATQPALPGRDAGWRPSGLQPPATSSNAILFRPPSPITIEPLFCAVGAGTFAFACHGATQTRTVVRVRYPSALPGFPPQPHRRDGADAIGTGRVPRATGYAHAPAAAAVRILLLHCLI